jgi:hypothetical protein
MHGFAGTGGIERELKQPSIKLVDPAKSETAQMTRKEVVEKQLVFIEHAYEKVRELPQTDDTKDILGASLALYEYVLPVYKNEYQQLARLYDAGAPESEIEAFRKHIRDRYKVGFQSHMDALLVAGKSYAAQQGIKVNWNAGGVSKNPDSITSQEP